MTEFSSPTFEVLSTMATLFSGGTPAKGDDRYWNGAIPWLTPKDMGSWAGVTSAFVTEAAIGNGTRLAPPNALYVAVRGMSLHKEIRIIRGEKPMAFNQDIKAIVPRQSISQRYLYHALEYRKQELLGNVHPAGHGTGVLPTELLLNLRIPRFAPALENRIETTLSAIDDKIELNRRMNETLEASARALFRDWFVDFGPTRAKMERREPYLAAKVWAHFPDRLNEDDSPAGWRLSSLDNMIEFNPRERLTAGEAAPYLDMAALPTSGPSAQAPILREFKAGSKFRRGDTLLARITPCLENGKTAFAMDLGDETVGWGSTEFIVMRSRAPVPKLVSYFIARDPRFRKIAIGSMTGTSGRQRATVDALMGYPFASPPTTDLWASFGMVCEPFFAKIAANDRENRTLAELRDLLLPKLMSGEVRVRDAEKLAGDRL